MLSVSNPMNILDYCNDFIEGKIRVDANYQRTDRVWPDRARGFLIESILLGYPVPKFFLHQKIDLKSKKSVKYVVDGQQRSKAIVDYFQNKFAISRKSEYSHLAGCKFDDLEDDYKDLFLSYSLPIDLFVTASRDEIIETFRRMNSYTIPLNNEEKRHAHYQGEMKWFISLIAKKYSEKLAELGVFTEKNLARMVDFKFFSELTLFVVDGELYTTSAALLNKLYQRYDEKFDDAIEVENKISNAIDFVVSIDGVKDLSVTKQHVFQMLLFAVVVAQNQSVKLLDRQMIIENLSELSEALEEGATHDSFVLAASKTTNDKNRKQIIYNFMYQAVVGNER